MAGYTGRRGPNMYSSIANLNTIPSEYELAMQQQQEGYNMQADLDLFTNAQFFDFDMAEMGTQSPTTFDENELMLSTARSGLPQQPLGFYDSEFPIAPFTTPTNILSNNHTATRRAASAPQPQHTLQYNSSVSSPSSVSTPLGDKRTADSIIDPNNPDSLEDASRAAAEEDKRRRNTAASARFRVKKKQREAALEKSAKEMTDRLSYLESRVGQLEMENKLLKDLITEKSGKDVDSSSEPSKKTKVESSKQATKKGVGTENRERKIEA